MSQPQSKPSSAPQPVIPTEGWHVLHLFYTVSQGPWQMMESREQADATVVSDMQNDRYSVTFKITGKYLLCTLGGVLL